MMLINTYVASSDIEGVGVFAAEPIQKGALIWRLDERFDRLIDPDMLRHYPEHMQEFLTRYAYPLHDRPDTLVLEVDNGRFMNHSDTPNTTFKDIVRGYALREIAKGEEILCDYNEFDPSHIMLPSPAPVAVKMGGKHQEASYDRVCL